MLGGDGHADAASCLARRLALPRLVWLLERLLSALLATLLARLSRLDAGSSTDANGMVDGGVDARLAATGLVLASVVVPSAPRSP